jgi:hydroxyacylglutathione hydrolase
MILKRLYDEGLAQASYLIGCAATGEALVIDPTRSADLYLEAAESERVAIKYITETHIHADFVSGVRELAARTGARLFLSDEGGPDWRYTYAKRDGATLLHDRDVFMVGDVRVQAIHTPGHTPEHMTFLITDLSGADKPIGAVTGDFVFVGDVGRPDLLETAAGQAGTMEASSRTLFRSLQVFKKQPDYLQIWPGHGEGSACGKGLSAIPHSTVGYERLFNWAFAIEDEQQFVAAILAGQPEPPSYFSQMKKINREGPRVLGAEAPGADALPSSDLANVLEAGAIVVDTRSASDFADSFIPGTINIPLAPSFVAWAGWLLPYDRGFYVIVEDAAGAERVFRELTLIGMEHITGVFTIDALSAYALQRGALATVTYASADELAGALRDGGATVLDVRGRAEWEGGHLPGSLNIPVGHISSRLDEVPRDRAIYVHCQTGQRSAIATSLLHANGFADVRNYSAGYAEWAAQGRTTEREPAAQGTAKNVTAGV